MKNFFGFFLKKDGIWEKGELEPGISAADRYIEKLTDKVKF
ncbi:hypothetical protein [Cytobacillus firmus]|nr:hypothetical protein [Cytobacillus firmus]